MLVDGDSDTIEVVEAEGFVRTTGVVIEESGAVEATVNAGVVVHIIAEQPHAGNTNIARISRIYNSLVSFFIMPFGLHSCLLTDQKSNIFIKKLLFLII
jgi:hypothetical protein